MPEDKGEHGRRDNNQGEAKTETAAADEDQGDAAGRTVYLQGLPWSTEESEIRSWMEGCGSIESVELPVGWNGRASGTAFVVFKEWAPAEAALGMNGETFPGSERSIKVIKGEHGRRDNAQGEAKPNTEQASSIFIGNLSWTLTEDEVRATFAPCGEISAIRFARDPEKGHFCGFGHVDFDSAEAAEAAVALAGTPVGGRPIRVDYSVYKQREWGSPTSGGRGAGGKGRGAGGKGKGKGRAGAGGKGKGGMPDDGWRIAVHKLGLSKEEETALLAEIKRAREQDDAAATQAVRRLASIENRHIGAAPRAVVAAEMELILAAIFAPPAPKRQAAVESDGATEDDCVFTGSRSAEERDAELLRNAISVAEDSDAEADVPKAPGEGAQPTGAGTLEDQLAKLRDGLEGDGFDVSVALTWCEENGADKLYEIVEAKMVDEFVASLALKPVKAKVLKARLRAFVAAGG